MAVAEALAQKVNDIYEELRRTGLSGQRKPHWVSAYWEKDTEGENDFSDWLQFVYLPNLLAQKNHHSYTTERTYIAPQAMQFLRHEIERTRLLQLLVELDSLAD